MSKTFYCSAPWQGLYINPDGDFRVCCAGKSLGNLNQSSLNDVLNGGELTKIQNEIITQGYSDYCNVCMESEDLSGVSMRDQFNRDITTFNTDKFSPNTIDIRWHNTCQLMCVYCNSEWSSAFASYEGKIHKVSETKWQTEVLEYLKNNKDSIKDINLLGGEPFLMKENTDLLELMKDNKEVGVHLVTNFALTDIETFPLYQQILNRDPLWTSWVISLESTGNRFEYIRRNAKWDILEQNYKKLITKGIKPSCNLTYCILSAFTLLETFDWFYEIDPSPNNNHHRIVPIYGPDHFNIVYFPKEVKLLAIEELSKVETKYNHYLNEQQLSLIQTTKQSLLDNLDVYNIDKVKLFKQFIEENDRLMGPLSFKQEWPQLQNILYDY